MAYWLKRHDHDVEVFAIEKVDAPDFKIETDQQDGYTVHRVHYNLKDDPDPFRNLYDSPQLGAALRELLSRRPFDLVHIISGYLLGGQAIFTARELGLPVVVSPMEYYFMCPQLNLIHPTGELCVGPENDQKCARCLMEDKRRYRLPAQVAPTLMKTFWGVAQTVSFGQETAEAVARRREYLQSALNVANRVVCNSEFIIHKFAEFGFDTQHFTYIRQGLATRTGTKPLRRPSEDGALRLGYIGQIKRHKGVDLLVDAAISLLKDGQNITLNLWGKESESPNYTAALKKRSAHYPAIHWNGRYTGSKVWDILADFDVLVIPSRWYENSPNVILEAFEMRLPVVVTNLGGMAELVTPEVNSLVFGLNDPADLACQLSRLITEPSLLERLRAGIPLVKTIDQEMEEIVAEYQNLIQERVKQNSA